MPVHSNNTADGGPNVDASLNHLISHVFGLSDLRKTALLEALRALEIDSADDLLLFSPDDTNLLTGIGLPTRIKFRRIIEYLQTIPGPDRHDFDWLALGPEVLIPTFSGSPPSHAATAPPSPRHTMPSNPPLPTVTPDGGPPDVDSVLSNADDSLAATVLASVQRSLSAMTVQRLNDEAAEFRKGIKRSKENYKSFSEDKFFGISGRNL